MLTCDAIKIAYRQSRDGFVISFAIHPQDIPAELANAAIGSQWALQLVELDDDGNAPDPSRQKDGRAEDHGGSSQAIAANRQAEPKATIGSAPRRSFTSLPLAQQAALLCQDPVFRSFIVEELDVPCENEEQAADAIRVRCGVTSRADIAADRQATVQFTADRDRFMAWKLVGA